MATLIVDGVRTCADVPESVRAARAWITECLSGAPAADDAAPVVSDLATRAILYPAPGQPGGLITVSIAIGHGVARIHVIDQGPRLEQIDTEQVTAIAAAAPRLGAGLTIVFVLADERTDEGPDKCFTLRIAGPGRSSLPPGPGESEPETER